MLESERHTLCLASDYWLWLKWTLTSRWSKCDPSGPSGSKEENKITILSQGIKSTKLYKFFIERGVVTLKCLAANTGAFGPFHTQRVQAEAISQYFIRNLGNQKQTVCEELVLHLQLECQKELEETQTHAHPHRVYGYIPICMLSIQCSRWD